MRDDKLTDNWINEKPKIVETIINEPRIFTKKGLSVNEWCIPVQWRLGII